MTSSGAHPRSTAWSSQTRRRVARSSVRSSVNSCSTRSKCVSSMSPRSRRLPCMPPGAPQESQSISPAPVPWWCRSASTAGWVRRSARHTSVAPSWSNVSAVSWQSEAIASASTLQKEASSTASRRRSRTWRSISMLRCNHRRRTKRLTSCPTVR
eukprot:42960-Prymnesium_polylepis.1